MERMITAGGKPYKIRASAGALVLYKAQFGIDYTEEISALEDGNEESAYIIGCRLLWAMARSVKEKLPTPNEFINGMKPKELVQALKVSQELFSLSLDGHDNSDYDEEKNFSAEELMADAALCGMSLRDLNELPLRMVIDTINKYAEKRWGDGSEYVSSSEFFGE